MHARADLEGFAGRVWREEVVICGPIDDGHACEHCGDENDVVFLHHAGGAHIHIGAVFNRVDPGADGGLYPVASVGVGGDFAAHGGGGLHDGVELIVEELLSRARICVGEHAASRGDLDQVSVTFDGGAHGAAAVGDTVADGL